MRLPGAAADVPRAARIFSPFPSSTASSSPLTCAIVAVRRFEVAQEIRHEQIRGCLVEHARGADLGHAGLVHHHDQVGHGQRLGLVMGDVDHGRADAAVNALDLDLHLLAQLLVERAQGLVHQQQARMRDQRPRHGDALLLAARELPRVAGAEMPELNQREHLVDALAGFLARQPRAHAKRKTDILGNGHVGK